MSLRNLMRLHGLRINPMHSTGRDYRSPSHEAMLAFREHKSNPDKARHRKLNETACPTVRLIEGTE